MKLWEKILAVGAASIIVLIAACSIGIVLYPTEDIEPVRSTPPIESEDVERTVEPRIDLRGIYTDVHLGMTEDEVRAVAGDPDMVSTSEVEGLGKMKDLMYNDGMDNVSVFIENGEVRMVIIGTFTDGDLDTKTKM
jgi:hypothetical protein